MLYIYIYKIYTTLHIIELAWAGLRTFPIALKILRENQVRLRSVTRQRGVKTLGILSTGGKVTMQQKIILVGSKTKSQQFCNLQVS